MTQSDFGADATVNLNEILLMPRSNFPERMKTGSSFKARATTSTGRT